ncbi:HMP-PP hydrolase (pyridoxal phosphatase) Cof, detected in genetic screen for thiamin metabolic genes [Hydrogenimonas sp.]|nr:HMP-PP hydrolase (pyridoxal phosphatase) Cof, detected in genetic screen for thiamin metabolic genes [Hydrogenimonas sp.]
MIDPRFLHLLFSTASIDRWNDQIRPVEFVELDKQSHKMITAWLLGRIEEEENGTEIDWRKLIDHGVCEFMYRAVLTDLKPPVFHHLAKHKKRELDAYVEKELFGIIGENLKEKFKKYTASDENGIERRILRAAHFLASRWEFGIIYDFHPNAVGVEEIKRKIDSEVEDYLDLTGVRRLEMGIKSRNFLETCAMLRFQKRWAKTPRIPQTSVLGHMFFVAVTTYLLSLDYGACGRKLYNNFFTALFHDIAESLTRDIISPVKYGVEGLDELLAEYEKDALERKLLPMLPPYLRDEMRYFVNDEFADKIVVDGRLEIIDRTDLMQTKYNLDGYNGIDGSLIKVADHIGAFIEAAASIHNGVKPQSLVKAKESLSQKYRGFGIYGMDIEEILKGIEASQI